MVTEIPCKVMEESWKMSENPASFVSLCNRAKRDIRAARVQTRPSGEKAVSHQTFCLIIVASRLFGPSFLVCSVIVATELCPKHCHCCFDPLGLWIWESQCICTEPFNYAL